MKRKKTQTTQFLRIRIRYLCLLEEIPSIDGLRSQLVICVAFPCLDRHRLWEKEQTWSFFGLDESVNTPQSLVLAMLSDDGSTDSLKENNEKHEQPSASCTRSSTICFNTRVIDDTYCVDGGDKLAGASFSDTAELKEAYSAQRKR